MYVVVYVIIVVNFTVCSYYLIKTSIWTELAMKLDIMIQEIYFVIDTIHFGNRFIE